MFFRRKEELEILQKSLESLENSQKNTEILVNSICQMVESNKKQNEIEEIDLDDEEKRRAAYALNLCAVSISQIVDYNDVNILEQEYETILNNLNLENMPKDEALLNVLKQILDTVTFFRIQEGDKEFIDKEYQHKMKNAIWSSVPNFGLIVGSGNWKVMALTLASQVGIGYMNYRRVKAETKLDKERQLWQLQRAAIEQLNGLRRELFDASWRLADRYEFKDEYRLTERQISQYNKILMDSDDLRRYERLEAIKDYFVAYPSFWYHFGHAASLIAYRAEINNELDVCSKYRVLAKLHFETYLKSNKYALLREDQITSSCSLEYIELLDSENDKEKIKNLIDSAVKSSGFACDVLQICAISYLKISCLNEAISLLKYLVNENYNAKMNAQLLSSIYVSEIVELKNDSYIADYKILKTKVPNNILFPLPNYGESIDELTEAFFDEQKYLLGAKYTKVIRSYFELCEIAFNKSIPVPQEGKIYLDTFFLEKNKQERCKQYKNLFANQNKSEEYVARLLNSDYITSYLNVLNKMVNDLEIVVPGNFNEKSENINKLVSIVRDKIGQYRNTFEKLQEKMGKNFSSGDMELLLGFSFTELTKKFLNELLNEIENHVLKIDSMAKLASEENMLLDFCVKHEIPTVDDIIFVTEENIIYKEYHNYFTNDLLGEEYLVRAETQNLARKMAKLFEERKQNIVTSNAKEKKQDLFLYIRKWSETEDLDFKTYFENKKYFKDNPILNNEIFAVIESKKINKMDLIFTTQGIICNKWLTFLDSDPKIIKFPDIKVQNKKGIIGSENYLVFDNDTYNDKCFSIAEFMKLVGIFSELAVSSNEKDTQKLIDTKN